MRKAHKGYTSVEVILVVTALIGAGLGIALVVALIRFLMTH